MSQGKGQVCPYNRDRLKCVGIIMFSHMRVLAVGCGCVLMLGTGLAAATEATALEEVVVTASRSETFLGETPAPVTRVDEAVLSSAKPRLISDVLDRVPGVHMVDLGNEQHSMSIRQPNTTNAVYQYLEDNVPIRPIGVFNHNALNEINLAGTGDIEVMRGPTSSLYGSNAVGGAVNFLSKAPSLMPEMWLGLRGSDQGYARLDAGWSVTRGNTGVRVSYYRSEVNDGWREYSEGHKDSLSVRVDQVLTDHSILQNVISHTDMVTDMTGSLGESDYQQRPQTSYQTFTERTDKATRVSSSLETEWSEERKSRVTLFWRDNSHGQIPSYSLGGCNPGGSTCTTNGRQNDNAYTSIGVDAQWQQALPGIDGRLIAGAGWDRTKNSFDEDNLSVTRAADLRYVAYNVTTKRRLYKAGIDNPSAYVQAELKPLARTTMVAGLRYDEVRYDFDNRLAPSPSTGAPDEQRTFSHVSPRFGVVQSLTDQSEAFVNLSEGFVPPEVSQLYSSLAVPTLKEAVFRNIDVGFRQRWGRTGKVEATLYRLMGEDEILSYTVSTAPLVRENRNAGSTVHEGLELGGSWRPLDMVSMYMSATLSRHQYDAYQPAPTERYDDNDMPGAPRRQGLVGVDWTLLPGLTLTPELQYIGSYWMNDLNTVRYPGHTLLNLKARWVHKQFELYGQVMNVADAHYAHAASSSFKSGVFNPDLQNSYTPGDPRMALVGVNYTFAF
jgi:iron complex outermembrane receptor protein